MILIGEFVCFVVEHPSQQFFSHVWMSQSLHNTNRYYGECLAKGHKFAPVGSMLCFCVCLCTQEEYWRCIVFSLVRSESTVKYHEKK